jgi:hypothetical protein
MDNIKHLLNQIAIVSKKNAEILDASGGRFNMFRICGVNHYENTHSAILAEFLNPNGTHGLKSKLLECFINTLGERFTLKNFNCERARVVTEYSTEEGRMDIFISNVQEEKVIIIENKVRAKDQPEQLKRYEKIAKKYKNGYQILYLTLWGNDASMQSGGGVDYKPISYQTDIITWLEKCVTVAVRHPMVRETINQYINHLKLLTNQDMNSKNKKEVVEIMAKNPKAVFDIAKNINDFKDKVVYDFFEKIAKDKEFEIERKGHKLYTQWSGVCFKKPDIKGKLCFQFDSDDFRRLSYGYLFFDKENPNPFEEFLKTKQSSTSEYWAFNKPLHISFTNDQLEESLEENNTDLYQNFLRFIENLLRLWEEWEEYEKTKQ